MAVSSHGAAMAHLQVEVPYFDLESQGSGHHGDDRGHGGGQKSHCQRYPATVPDAGEDIPAHGVGAEPELPRRRGGAVGKIHIGGVAARQQRRAQATQHDHRQHGKGDKRQLPPPLGQSGGRLFRQNAHH